MHSEHGNCRLCALMYVKFAYVGGWRRAPMSTRCLMPTPCPTMPAAMDPIPGIHGPLQGRIQEWVWPRADFVVFGWIRPTWAYWVFFSSWVEISQISCIKVTILARPSSLGPGSIHGPLYLFLVLVFGTLGGLQWQGHRILAYHDLVTWFPMSPKLKRF